MDNRNILLTDWDLPPFDRIQATDYEPAIGHALAEAEARVEAIATSADAPTFANTIETLEQASTRLDRIVAVLTNLNECCTSPQLQAIAERVEPRLAQFSTRVSTDRRLFARVRAVHDSAEADSLPVEQRTLLDNTYRGFTRHGALLTGDALDRYRAAEEELASLKLRFGQNALADTNAFALTVTDAADLEGLPPTAVEAAAAEARARGQQGWVFTLAAPSYIPFMAHSARRDLRRRMYLAHGAIGGHGDDHDNNAIIRRIVQLRAEQARLLGFDTYADYVVANRMVKSRANLDSFMARLMAAAVPAARADLAALEEVKDFDGDIRPWDVSYLAERLRRRRFDFDAELLRPYLPLPAVLDGVFGLYGRLYGLRFAEATDVPVYHPDVRVFRVSQGDAAPLGLLYLDLHSRPSKRSGAWMTEFRGQAGPMRPQIQVVCNFTHPTADHPALLSFDEFHTLMHEMGHAMHGMLSQVQYESLSGTNVMRDFVELPSQLMENWCYEPDFLATFARHWQTGEPMPAAFVDKIRAAQHHMAGWLMLRQLNLGLTDLAFHTMDTDGFGPDGKAETVEAHAMTDLVPREPGCCTATSFSHIFNGGYAAGYYGYKWAEALDADAFTRFRDEGIFNPGTAAELRQAILSRGGTEHPAVLFRRFMHRDPDPDALLRKAGIEPHQQHS